jgi:hypothetical protein
MEEELTGPPQKYKIFCILLTSKIRLLFNICSCQKCWMASHDDQVTLTSLNLSSLHCQNQLPKNLTKCFWCFRQSNANVIQHVQSHKQGKTFLSTENTWWALFPCKGNCFSNNLGWYGEAFSSSTHSSASSRIPTLKYSSRRETVLTYPQNLRLTRFDPAARAGGFKGVGITDAARATGLGFLVPVSIPEKELGTCFTSNFFCFFPCILLLIFWGHPYLKGCNLSRKMISWIEHVLHVHTIYCVKCLK